MKTDGKSGFPRTRWRPPAMTPEESRRFKYDRDQWLQSPAGQAAGRQLADEEKERIQARIAGRQNPCPSVSIRV